MAITAVENLIFTIYIKPINKCMTYIGILVLSTLISMGICKLARGVWKLYTLEYIIACYPREYHMVARQYCPQLMLCIDKCLSTITEACIYQT